MKVRVCGHYNSQAPSNLSPFEAKGAISMTTAQRTFAQRIGYCITCVIPASLLSDEATSPEDASSLRVDASHDGLSYLQVSHALSENVYVCRVAASPDRVAHGYTVLFTEEQLYFALPWDHRLEWEDRLCTQKRDPESILTLLRACAAEVRPLVKITPSQAVVPPQPVPAAAEIAFEARSAQTIEIRAEELQDALGLTPRDTAKDTATHISQKGTYRMQQAFLRAAVDTLMTQLYQGQDRAHALTIKAKCALVARVQRWHRQTRQHVVNAALAFDAQEQRMLWQLTIGVPAMTDLAA